MTIPPTIHPILVHFPIALLFTAAFIDVVAWVRKSRTWESAGFIVLVLGVISVALAIIAGGISQRYVVPSPDTAKILAAHRRDGVVTGIVFLAVLLLRLTIRQRTPAGTERLKSPLWAVTLGSYVAGAGLLSATGIVGGSLVYDHGLGTTNITYGGATHPRPAASSTASPAATQSAQISAGRQIWVQTCSRCHGNPPQFTHQFVTARGNAALTQFIAQKMPPGRPIGTTPASEVVAYLNSLTP